MRNDHPCKEEGAGAVVVCMKVLVEGLEIVVGVGAMFYDVYSQQFFFFGDAKTHGHVDNFEENKRLVSELIDVPPKTLRNEVAGYVVRIKKKKLIMPRSPVPTVSVRPDVSRRRRGRRYR